MPRTTRIGLRTIAASRRAASLAASLLGAAGCSSGSGSPAAPLPANVAALQTAYTSPTGTFELSDVPAVLAALSADGQTPSNLPLVFCDIPPQAGDAGNPCCTTGTVTQTESAPVAGATQGTLAYQDCSFAADLLSTGLESNVSVTGTVDFVQFGSAASGYDTIYSGTLNETLLPDGGPQAISANFAMPWPGTAMTFVVPVASGSVLLKAQTWSPAAGGNFDVTDSLGTWACSVSSNIGVCSNVGGMRSAINWIAAADGGVSAYLFDAGFVPSDASGD
jgi:hypothetical protein